MILKAIKKFFRGNKGNPNAVIDDEMRIKALEVRRQNAAIRQLERQHESQKKLELLEKAITGEKKGNPLEDMFMQLIMTKFLTGQQPQQKDANVFIYGDTTIPQQPTTEQPPALNDNQINEAVKVIKAKLPTEAKEFIIRVSDEDLIKIKYKLME